MNGYLERQTKGFFRLGKTALIMFVILTSCKKEPGRNFTEDYAKGYINANFQSYREIYAIANDTLNNWIEDSLERAGACILYPYQIDSAMVFNSDSTKLYTTVNYKSTTFNDAVAEDSEEFYGAKINGKWYFAGGASLFIPRNFYQDSLYAPMTFDEISYVAHVNFIQNYLRKNLDGSFYPNENLFKEKFIHCIVPYGYEHLDFDSAMLAYQVQERHKKKDKKDIYQALAEAAKTIRPLEPPTDLKTGHSMYDINDPHYQPFYPKDTMDWVYDHGRSFYKKRNWWQKYWHPFQPRIFGRQKEDDPWK